MTGRLPARPGRPPDCVADGASWSSSIYGRRGVNEIKEGDRGASNARRRRLGERRSAGASWRPRHLSRDALHSGRARRHDVYDVLVNQQARRTDARSMLANCRRIQSFYDACKRPSLMTDSRERDAESKITTLECFSGGKRSGQPRRQGLGGGVASTLTEGTDQNNAVTE